MRLGMEYIAAFLDCDGTVGIVRGARKTEHGFEYYGKITFYSQNLAVLKNIQETIGGNIFGQRTTACYQLQLGPRATVAALPQVLPYLQIKREQALVVLLLHEQINRTPRIGRSHPKEVWAEREALYWRVRELNHVDSQAFRTNRVNSGKALGEEVTLSQAAEGKGSAEGATTREVTPKNNPLHECPARKGRDSLSSADSTRVN